MSKNGLLIHYDFCTGCHACEVACKKEHGLEDGCFGIKLAQYGPQEYDSDKWDYIFLPFPTSSCDLCAERVDVGKMPSCVHHCQSKVIHYGPADELVTLADNKEKVALFIPLK